MGSRGVIDTVPPAASGASFEAGQLGEQARMIE